MVGCGASAEDKKAIADNTTQIAALQKNIADMQKMGTDVSAKVGMIETFLKDPKSKMGMYGMPPDTTTTKTTTKTTPGNKTTTTKTTTTKTTTTPATKTK
jgi:hypothetical protein